MAHLIDKDALVAEIERRIKEYQSTGDDYWFPVIENLKSILSSLDTIEAKDPYEQCVQYDSIKAGIQAHAETYSFNIKSELFNQLSPEQQKLWRKEIEQACISGGDAGYSLAKDPRYKENLEVKEVDIDKEIEQSFIDLDYHLDAYNRVEDYVGENLDMVEYKRIAKHFFELGVKVRQG